MWKDFLYFSKNERIGIYVLIGLIAITISVNLFISFREDKSELLLSEKEKKEYSDFIRSIRKQEEAWQSHYNSYANNKQVVILSPFDPNTADSITFIQLGLKPYIARNILRYRAKGGKFRTPQAFAKIYGITDGQFKTLLPYIIIDESFQHKRDTLRAIFIGKGDSLHVFKYAEGTVIDINNADTTELKKIPGIGSGIARMIIAYRNKLGGFYNTKQIQEVKYVPAGTEKWFHVQNNLTRRINLNKASIERISAHPYMNFYQAKVIVEYRKKKGALRSLNQLALYEEFTSGDLERMSHYVEF